MTAQMSSDMVELHERVREAIENAVLASAIANEPFGAQAARATTAALEASHHAELVEMLRQLRAYPSVRAAIGQQFLAQLNALLAKIGDDA